MLNQEVVKILKTSKNIVAFTGAGISVPSGIPDFRSANGIYNMKSGQNIPPEQIISHSFFMKHPSEFFQFYFDKMVYLNSKPNEAHYWLTRLEKEGRLKAVITQNIDGLDHLAGCKNVIELHGTVHKNHCLKCNRLYNAEETYHLRDPESSIPHCVCGGIIKPDVVLYEESLNYVDIDAAISLLHQADTVVVIGTSLVVYPAAGFLQAYEGNKLILINKSKTSYDEKANFVINDDIINVVDELNKLGNNE